MQADLSKRKFFCVCNSPNCMVMIIAGLLLYLWYSQQHKDPTAIKDVKKTHLSSLNWAEIFPIESFQTRCHHKTLKAISWENNHAEMSTPITTVHSDWQKRIIITTHNSTQNSRQIVSCSLNKVYPIRSARQTNSCGLNLWDYTPLQTGYPQNMQLLA